MFELTEEELEVLQKIVRHSRYNGNGWYVIECRRNVYLRDKERFKRLERIEANIFNKIVGDEI